VIGRDGTLVAKLGGAYRPDELRALVEHALISQLH
jgi:hypothetical protein